MLENVDLPLTDHARPRHFLVLSGSTLIHEALSRCCKPTRRSAISGSRGRFPPLPKRLASRFFHSVTGRKVAIYVEEPIDGGVDIQKSAVLIQGT